MLSDGLRSRRATVSAGSVCTVQRVASSLPVTRSSSAPIDPRVPAPAPRGPCCVIIPAFNAERTIGHVVSSLLEVWGRADARDDLIVVNDGSVDATAELARRAGAYVLSHAHNRGKGAALLSGIEEAQRRGATCVVTLDADGQHFAEDALRLLQHPAGAESLLLGVRNLQLARAPRANRFSNALSNFFLSWFSGTRLADTQCGLRRYPVNATLAAGTRARGFAFETEILLIAALEGWPIQQLPIQVHYPPPGERTTHFDNVRDPTRIVTTVLRTMTERHVVFRRNVSL
jgi:glycosyltransferase involved in cell wall biosynthesis